MALQTKVVGPGGFESESGYRRVIGLHVDFVHNTILIGVGDYKDEAWRKSHPVGYVNNHAYQLDAHSRPADQTAVKDADGKVQVVDVEAVPSGAEFLAQPIGTYLAEVGPETTIEAILGAICYGYAKTRIENRDAVDC